MGSTRHADAGQVLFENLLAGMTIDEVIEQFPVTRGEIDGLMAFVARSLEKAPDLRIDWRQMRILFNYGSAHSQVAGVS